MFQGKVKAKDLRGKKKDELLKQLDELKTVGDTFNVVDPLLAPLHLSLINSFLHLKKKKRRRKLMAFCIGFCTGAQKS